MDEYGRLGIEAASADSSLFSGGRAKETSAPRAGQILGAGRAAADVWPRLLARTSHEGDGAGFSWWAPSLGGQGVCLGVSAVAAQTKGRLLDMVIYGLGRVRAGGGGQFSRFGFPLARDEAQVSY